MHPAERQVQLGPAQEGDFEGEEYGPELDAASLLSRRSRITTQLDGGIDAGGNRVARTLAQRVKK